MKKPPTSGPATAERPNSAPIGPMYFARSRAGTTSAMIACDRIISPPPPRPCTPRQIDQPGEVRRQRGAEAGDGEQADRDEEQVPAAPEVAELAVDRHDERGGQQVGGGHPRHVGDAAEVADDRRHRRRDDRLVEGGHEHAGEQRREDQVDPAPGQDDRRRGGVGEAGRARGLLRSYVGAAGARRRGSGRRRPLGGSVRGPAVRRSAASQASSTRSGRDGGEVAGEPAVQGRAHRDAGDRRPAAWDRRRRRPGCRCARRSPRRARARPRRRTAASRAEQRRVRVDHAEPQRPQLGLRRPSRPPGSRATARSAWTGDSSAGRARKACDLLRRGVGVEAEDGVVLGREVVEEGARGDVGPGGDVVDRHVLEPALGDQLERGLVEGEPGGELLALAQSRRHATHDHRNLQSVQTCSHCTACRGRDGARRRCGPDTPLPRGVGRPHAVAGRGPGGTRVELSPTNVRLRPGSTWRENAPARRCCAGRSPGNLGGLRPPVGIRPGGSTGHSAAHRPRRGREVPAPGPCVAFCAFGPGFLSPRSGGRW